MGKWILRMFSLNTILDFGVDVILGTIKNPDSPEARGIYAIMVRVRDAVNVYFQRVSPPGA